MSKIILGNKVKDLVTGIAVASIKYINGCEQFQVKPQSEKESIMPKGQYIDKQSLLKIDTGIVKDLSMDRFDVKWNSFQLGNKLKCKVTGFIGIAVAEMHSLNGLQSYGIAPKVDKDNKPTPDEYIDCNLLEFIDKGIAVEEKPTGGPQRFCPKS